MADDVLNSCPWDREPGEPVAWFDRFEAYRLLGARSRSIVRVWRDEVGVEGDRAPNSWWLNSQKWRWQERAEAWDAVDRERRLGEMEERRLAFRDRLRAVSDKALAEAERRLDFLAGQLLDGDNTTEAGFVRLAEWAERVGLDSLTVPLLERLEERLQEIMRGHGAKAK